MYLCFEIIMNGIHTKVCSPLKSSQGLSVRAESPFTFQPGLPRTITYQLSHRPCKGQSKFTYLFREWVSGSMYPSNAR